MPVRGPKVIQQIVTVRGNQNIIMMMVLGGVFASAFQTCAS